MPGQSTKIVPHAMLRPPTASTPPIVAWLGYGGLVPFVLLAAVNVNDRPFGDVAVTGMISDFPAGIVTLPKGSITGAARPANARMGITAKR